MSGGMFFSSGGRLLKWLIIFRGAFAPRIRIAVNSIIRGAFFGDIKNEEKKIFRGALKENCIHDYGVIFQPLFLYSWSMVKVMPQQTCWTHFHIQYKFILDVAVGVSLIGTRWVSRSNICCKQSCCHHVFMLSFNMVVEVVLVHSLVLTKECNCVDNVSLHNDFPASFAFEIFHHRCCTLISHCAFLSCVLSQYSASTTRTPLFFFLRRDGCGCFLCPNLQASFL